MNKQYKPTVGQLSLISQQATASKDADFHLRLTFFVKRAPYSLPRIAATVQIGTSTLDRWLGGGTEPNATETKALCKLLGCTPNELIGLDDSDLLPLLSRRELRILEILTHGGLLNVNTIKSMAHAVNRHAGEITRLELLLNGIAGVVEELEAIKSQMLTQEGKLN